MQWNTRWIHYVSTENKYLIVNFYQHNRDDQRSFWTSAFKETENPQRNLKHHSFPLLLMQSRAVGSEYSEYKCNSLQT